jgi:DNA-binding transcriptional ArsR family regulator
MNGRPKNSFGRLIINRNIAMDMGATKSEEFSVRENRVAKYAKALAHPARVAILKLLASKAACQCGDIVDELPLSQSTVSQHLKELKAAGLITGEIEGVKVCYCINVEEWKLAQATLNELFSSRKDMIRCC